MARPRSRHWREYDAESVEIIRDPTRGRGFTISITPIDNPGVREYLGSPDSLAEAESYAEIARNEIRREQAEEAGK